MRRLILIGLFAAASCAEKAPPPEPRDTEPAGAPTEVAAIDEFVPLECPVDALAFWSHPTLAFNGLVIAAGDAGLVAFNIEDGDEVARDEAPVSGVAISYLGTGADAVGYLATRARGGERAFRFLAVDNASRALRLLDSLVISDRSADARFCLGRTSDGRALVLHEVGGFGWRWSPLTIAGSMVAAGEGGGVEVSPDGLTRCVADDVDGAVFAISRSGALFRLADGAAERIAETGVEDADGIGLALNGLVEGGPTDQCCGQIAVLDGEAGVVRLFDREDGRAVGAARLKASYEVDAVASAAALGFGNGNFGGVYRDGVVALATAGDRPSIRLTPLNGLMDALGAPLGPTADPRDLAPQPDEARVIDIELVNP